MVPDFLSFDVETANSKRSSICAIGYVVVKNRTIIKKCELIVNPEENFDSRNSQIHGLAAEDVLGGPIFHKVWSNIKEDFLNYPLVAHNMQFDIGCIKAALNQVGHTADFNDLYCTLKLSGKKLNVICEELGVPLDHHSPLSDAMAAALIFDKLFNNNVPGTAMDVKLKLRKKLKSSKKYHTKIKSEFLKPKQVVGGNNPFTSKKAVITGVFADYKRNEIAEMLYKVGADIDTSVTKKTDYLIAGKNMGPSKRKKAEDLGVRIINEQEFAEMIASE